MESEKPLVWIASSKKDLLDMPEDVIRTMGFVLGKVQNGEDDVSISPLTERKEFKGGKVREISDDDNGNTYRSVFTIEHEEAVFVLHCFHKKSKRGIKTPDADIERIVERLKAVDRFRVTQQGQQMISDWKARTARP